MPDDIHPVRLSVSQVEFMQHLMYEKGIAFYEEECRDLLGTIDDAVDKVVKYSTVVRIGDDEIELTSKDALDTFLEDECNRVGISHNAKRFCSDCSNYTRITHACKVVADTNTTAYGTERVYQNPTIANAHNKCTTFEQRTDLIYKFLKWIGRVCDG